MVKIPALLSAATSGTNFTYNQPGAIGIELILVAYDIDIN